MSDNRKIPVVNDDNVEQSKQKSKTKRERNHVTYNNIAIFKIALGN